MLDVNHSARPLSSSVFLTSPPRPASIKSTTMPTDLNLPAAREPHHVQITNYFATTHAAESDLPTRNASPLCPLLNRRELYLQILQHRPHINVKRLILRLIVISISLEHLADNLLRI